MAIKKASEPTDMNAPLQNGQFLRHLRSLSDLFVGLVSENKKVSFPMKITQTKRKARRKTKRTTQTKKGTANHKVSQTQVPTPPQKAKVRQSPLLPPSPLSHFSPTCVRSASAVGFEGLHLVERLVAVPVGGEDHPGEAWRLDWRRRRARPGVEVERHGRFGVLFFWFTSQQEEGWGGAVFF